MEKTTGMQIQGALTDRLAGSFDTRTGDVQLHGGCQVEQAGRILAWTGRPRFDAGTPEAFLAGLPDSDWNPDALLAHIHGPFALVLAEPARRRCLLAVDRLGIQPLAWREAAGCLRFASDLDGLFPADGPRPELDPQGVFDYVYFHMIPAPRTIYRDTHKLEPASCLVFDAQRMRQRRYWRLAYAETRPERAAAEARLRSLLEAAVAAQLEDRPTGTFLSGGLDSTAVSGMFARLHPGPVPAFTVGFEAEGYDETPWARAAAAHFGLKLRVRYVTPEDVLEALPRVAAAQDEPFGNASALAAYFCARSARESGIEILLAGDGGDELFAGNTRYLKQLRLAHYERLPAVLRDRLLTPLARLDTPLHRLPLVRKAVSYVRQASLPMPERMESYNLLLRAGITQVFTPEFLAEVELDEPLRLLEAAYRGDESFSLLKHMLALDLKITLADNDLRKVSRMCRLAGVEVRYPMLDEELVGFSATLPSPWLIERGELRAFYRRALADFLPRATLEKSKHGFGLPFGVWSAEHPGLAQRVDAALERLARRGWIRADYLADLRRRHTREHAAYYGVMVWVLTLLETWLAHHGY